MQKWWNWVLAFALFCLLFIAIPLAMRPTEADLKPFFDDYLKQFNKTYRDPKEYLTRFQYFVAAVNEINTLNAASRGPESSRAKYGLTHLSDMSKSEFRDIHLADERQRKSPALFGKSWNKYRDTTVNNDHPFDEFEPRASHQRNRSHFGNEPHDNIYIIIRKKRATLPMKVDWTAFVWDMYELTENRPVICRPNQTLNAKRDREMSIYMSMISDDELHLTRRDKGVVGLVRDQGLCGACWAFSTIATMESMNAIKNGNLDVLSVQQVIDCAGLGNTGCAGGDICLLLDWLHLTNTPVELEQQYPLKLTDGACKAKVKNATGVSLSTFTCDDFVGSEDKILEALATHGPVTVAVNALTWQNYLGGVIQYHCSGAPADLNHAVQLVGYDLSADVPYYIAKNSWGGDFGNAGFLMLAVGGNVCGLANEVATLDVK